MDKDVETVLNDKLTKHFGSYGPLFGTDHSVGCIRNAVLAALAAENYAVVKLPEGVAVAHGARLVVAYPTGPLYAIEATP